MNIPEHTQVQMIDKDRTSIISQTRNPSPSSDRFQRRWVCSKNDDMNHLSGESRCASEDRTGRKSSWVESGPSFPKQPLVCMSKTVTAACPCTRLTCHRRLGTSDPTCMIQRVTSRVWNLFIRTTLSSIYRVAEVTSQTARNILHWRTPYPTGGAR